jgi:predicted Zn-dependent peptidase
MKPRDIDELKNAIKNEITAMRDNMVRVAMRKSRDRLEHRRRDGGKQLKDVLFKK